MWLNCWLNTRMISTPAKATFLDVGFKLISGTVLLLMSCRKDQVRKTTQIQIN